ncbi:MAG: hypothetical protein IPP37_14570 [Saprospiraceae bacterium]|nr:hypothetical protein [Saprospiraceae bacterium]
MKKIFITSSLNEKKIMFNWIKFSFRLFLPFLFSIIFIDKINAQLECANELPVNYIPVGDCNYPTPNINYTIPVYFHEVYSSVTANPSLSPEYLQSILNQINEEFTLYGLNIQFVMAKFDEKGSCFTGLKFHDYTEGAGTIYQDLAGSHIADDEIYPNQADRDFIFSHYLNLWLSDVLYAGSPQAHSLAKGFGVFPEEIEPFPSGLNGNNVFFNREQFDAGLFCHEIGHNFGLFHIFEGGGCNAPNDCDHGDRILSIPSCQLLYINNEIDCKDYKVCNSNIDYPAENFMSYTDPCRSEFVEEQYKRMAKYIDYFQPLSSSTNLGIVLAGNSSSVLSNPFTINQNHTSQRFETTTNSTLFIDGNVELNDCDLFLGPSSKIIVKTGSTLTLSATLLSSTNCSALLWQGIEVEEGASLIIKENTVLENAYIGVFAKATSTLQFENTIIRDCYVGVKLNEKATPPNLPIPLDIDILKFSNVQILGSSNLLFHLEHSTSEGSYAGIQIDDVSLAPFVSGNATINTIQGFKYGILSKGSTLLAENMELQKNAWGVKTSSYTKKYFPVILKNIDIFDCTVGVDVDQASTYINDLNFWTNDIGLKLNRCYGGEVINCNQTLTRIPNVGFKILNSSHIQFDNNYIIGEQDNLFSNCHNLKMNNCTIDHFTFNAVRKSSFSENTFEVLNNEAHGIIAGGNDNVFECNYYFSLVGDALVNDNSPDNTFRCNEFEGFVAGMVFEGNSVGTDFEANSFTSSNIGLDFKGWDSQIGLQVDKGNIFPGCVDEIGAKNDNSEYFFSLIINNNNLFFNPSHSPNDWFLQNSQESAAFCGNSCINGAGDDFVSWEGEQYSKCLDSCFMAQNLVVFPPKQNGIYFLLCTVKTI